MSPALSEPLLTGLALALLAGCGLSGLWTCAAGRARWLPRVCAGCAGYLLVVALAVRGVRSGGWPFGSAHEAVLLTAAAAALLYVLGVPRRLSSAGGACVGFGAVLLVGLSLLLVPAGARSPQPASAMFASALYPLHVVTAALGYGGLLLAGTAGLGRLLAGGGRGLPPERGWIGEDLEALAWRGLAWGYPCLTLGMVVGAAWSWLTWGWYWSWGTKEVLTLLTWGLFTMALHTRRLAGWRGRPHAAVLATGLLALLVTLLAAGALARALRPAVQYIF